MLDSIGGHGMNSGRTIFAQLLDHLPMHEFRKCVARYRGDHRVRTFSCWDQLLSMIFAQLTYRESLRDIVVCLRSQSQRLYHMGFRSQVSRSTLADANEVRDWRIYADFAQVLIARARQLYADEDLGLDLGGTVYALDSTMIDLCISLFPWARYKPDQHAVKVHTLLDLRGNIPTFIRITPAQLHDVHFLDHIVLEPGAFYVIAEDTWTSRGCIAGLWPALSSSHERRRISNSGALSRTGQTNSPGFNAIKRFC